MARVTKDSWSDAIDRAKDHFNAGWKELGRAGELAKGKGQDSWEEAQEKGRDAWVNAKARGMEMWEDAKSSGLDKLDEVRERGEEWFEDAGQHVRKKPLQALGLTIVVALVLGALVGRKND